MSTTSDVTLFDAETSASQGVIGNQPALVFQMSAILTFQAFRSGTEVLVKMTNTVGQPNAERTLTPSQPTATVPYKLWVGNGWMQLNNGTIDLELQTSGGQPTQVIATAQFETCPSSGGSCFGTLGGTYILPL